jgi:hypothetical protein
LVDLYELFILLLRTDPLTGHLFPNDEKSMWFSAALVDRLLRTCTSHLDESLPFVCNNAAWCIGELAMRLMSPVLFAPHINPILDRLVNGLQSHELSDNLKVIINEIL